MRKVIHLAGVDRSQLEREKPSLKACSVRAFQTSIEWSGPFQSQMARLCADREFPGPLPGKVGCAVIRSEGLILLWPSLADGFPVVVSRKGRRTTTVIPEAFASLKLHLPVGILIAVPVTRYNAGHLGHTLALHFGAAQFLYRQSKGSAIGLQE